jgi:hypothetical protein
MTFGSHKKFVSALNAKAIIKRNEGQNNNYTV